MRPFHFLAVLALALTGACATSQRATAPEGGDPAWISILIADLASKPVANPAASVVSYSYRAATVYYVPPRCCDIRGTLYDAAGTVICQPDGGFDGRGDGRCPDFFDARKDERVVWRDPRGV